MKNQYFGDNRDLFKYDLILQVIRGIDSINHFTFITMLTENDDTKQGGERNRYKAKIRKKNKELIRFLDEFGNESKRDIKYLKSFFDKKGIEMTIYYGKNKYFSHLQREEYFKQIEDKLLSKSLVFVDPDIGLQVKRTRDKHIRYSEVQNLYERMDKGSVLMIFQFIPRENRAAYFPRISKTLIEKVGDLPVYISDNQVVFFFLTKDKSIGKQLTKLVKDYVEKDYSRLSYGVTVRDKNR